VAPGKSKTVRIRIPARHRKVLKRLGRVRVRVTVAAYQQLGAARVARGRKAGLTLRTHRLRAR
jgi:hypothetical protein